MSLHKFSFLYFVFQESCNLETILTSLLSRKFLNTIKILLTTIEFKILPLFSYLHLMPLLSSKFLNTNKILLTTAEYKIAPILIYFHFMLFLARKFLKTSKILLTTAELKMPPTGPIWAASFRSLAASSLTLTSLVDMMIL